MGTRRTPTRKSRFSLRKPLISAAICAAIVMVTSPGAAGPAISNNASGQATESLGTALLNILPIRSAYADDHGANIGGDANTVSGTGQGAGGPGDGNGPGNGAGQGLGPQSNGDDHGGYGDNSDNSDNSDNHQGYGDDEGGDHTNSGADVGGSANTAPGTGQGAGGPGDGDGPGNGAGQGLGSQGNGGSSNGGNDGGNGHGGSGVGTASSSTAATIGFTLGSHSATINIDPTGQVSVNQ